MSDSFFSEDVDLPLQQGDLFLTSGVTRVGFANAAHTPMAWSSFSTHRSDFAPSLKTVPGLTSLSGRAAVMVVSHDCHIDKEVNIRARELMREHKLSEDEAYARAEDDDSLDRHVVVAPVIRVDDLVAPEDKDGRGQLLSGRRIGYLPLPTRPEFGINDLVVDLGYRCTVDRLTLTQRLVSLSDDARVQLRYALARMDSLRTPDIGVELEKAVGQKVIGVDRPMGKRMTIVLHLSDGSDLELLPRPAATQAQGQGRQLPPSTTE